MFVPIPRILTVLLCWLGWIASASAQAIAPPGDNRFELDEDIRLPVVDGSILGQLDRFEQLLADGQWEEAVNRLLVVAAGGTRRTTIDDGHQLIPVGDGRYLGVNQYVRSQLLALPPRALKIYRSRVDPLAEAWYRQGVDRRDNALLRRVVDEAPASSYADDTLMALGEIALEKADYASARAYWEQLIPAASARPSQPSDVSKPSDETGGSNGLGESQPTAGERSPDAAAAEQPITPASLRAAWPRFPDTDFPLAAVRARLVLASILAGELQRAGAELDRMEQLHADASGRLGGREVVFVGKLGELLSSARSWPEAAPTEDWPTFAGAPTRDGRAARRPDPAGVAWRYSLSPTEVGSDRVVPAVAESVRAPLSYYPVFAEGRLFVADASSIHGLQADTGDPPWPGASRTIFHPPGNATSPSRVPGDAFGTPRYTLTVYGKRLYARLGSPVTVEPAERERGLVRNELVCLDLAAEGRLLWRATAEEGWAFEGAPLADHRGVYVAMRRADVRTESHVACFDPATGRLRWRQFVAAALTPAGNTLHQISHNLLTLAGNRLFHNTNLGAVAALSAEDGELHWAHTYPRELQGDLLAPALHWARELNPCVYDDGRVLVAPADSPRIYAFDAATGNLLWQSPEAVADAVGLLGTTGQHVIAGGGRLYWLRLDGPRGGRIDHLWPDGPDRPGWGRGLIADGEVLFPTRERIHAFDARTAAPRRVIELSARDATGGNLMVADGRLIIATERELIGFRLAPKATGGQPKQARRPARPSRSHLWRETTLTSAPSRHTSRESP